MTEQTHHRWRSLFMITAVVAFGLACLTLAVGPWSAHRWVLVGGTFGNLLLALAMRRRKAGAAR